MRPLPSDLLTVPQAARVIGVSPVRAYAYVSHGTLPAQKLGGLVWVVWREDARAFRRPPRGPRPK